MVNKITRQYYILRKKYGFLRHYVSDILSYKVPKHTKNNVYIFGIPTHANIGDQAIAIATREFVNRQLSNKKIVEIPDFAVTKVAKYLKKYDKESRIPVIFLGGGNMGDSWPQADIYKHEVYKHLPNAIFIQFPQSTSFMANGYNLSLVIDDLKRVDSTVISRETLSFDFMKSNFINTNVFLSPDIVLSLNMKSADYKRKYVTTFFRNDIEKEPNELIDRVNDYLINHTENLRKSDTVVSGFKGTITEKNRQFFFLNKINEFRESKLIVTDRLHGMIFACITGTPAVVFDNSNHKVKFTYQNWLKNVPYIYFAEDDFSLEAVEKQIALFLGSKKDYEVPIFSKEYKPIIDWLKSIN